MEGRGGKQQQQGLGHAHCCLVVRAMERVRTNEIEGLQFRKDEWRKPCWKDNYKHESIECQHPNVSRRFPGRGRNTQKLTWQKGNEASAVGVSEWTSREEKWKDMPNEAP